MWLRMVTLCGHCGGSHSARAGGTIQAASAVSTRMMPLTACSNCPRRWICSGMLVADVEGARHHRDLARGVVHIAAVNGYGIGHGTIATKIGRTSPNGKR